MREQQIVISCTPVVHSHSTNADDYDDDGDVNDNGVDDDDKDDCDDHVINQKVERILICIEICATVLWCFKYSKINYIYDNLIAKVS